MNPNFIDIVFDKMPGPDGCNFIEVENSDRRSISFGEWVRRSDGYSVLRIPYKDGLVLTPRSEFENLLERELIIARLQHADFRTFHEAYAVILEELEEFWDLVRMRPSQLVLESMRAELVQVAAMCRRAAEDLGLLVFVLGSHPSISAAKSSPGSAA